MLITGGTGVIGRETARQLVDGDEKIVLFDISPREKLWNDIKDEVVYVRGDLTNFSSVLNIVKENQAKSIYHLASMLSQPSEVDPWSSYQVNVNGMMHILEAARLIGVDKLVYTSSVAASHYPEVQGTITDFTLQRPRLMYGVTKLFGELMGRFYNNKFGLDFRAVRFPAIISLGVKTMGVGQCIPWALEHAVKGISYDLWLEPSFKIGILYYKDAARALTMVHDAPKEQITTMCYNVKGEYFSSIQEFVDTIKKHISGSEIGFKPDPDIMKALGSGFLPMDDSKAREEWNWKAKYSADEMILDFIKELQTNKNLYE